MLRIDSLENGIVIDHITAGKGMKIYELLELDQLDSCVAIIKIDNKTDIDLDVLGFIDNKATVCIIKNGELKEKKVLTLPKQLVNIERCKNPRCITSIEKVDQIFDLSDEKTHRYRCRYCEHELEEKS